MRAWPTIELLFSRQTAWRSWALPVCRHDLAKYRGPHILVCIVATNHALVEYVARRYPPSSLKLKSSRLQTRKSRVRTYKSDSDRWAWSKLYSLLSAHHLIGAYFLTTEGDKRMRLLTRLYGICCTLDSDVLFCMPELRRVLLLSILVWNVFCTTR